MYFNSRTEAGQKLADELMHHKDDQPVIVALGNGAVVVGEQIARQLRGNLSLFLSEAIHLPGENLAIGTVNQGGGFTYNSGLSDGEVDDYYAEFHGYIEDQKREKTSRINRLLSAGDGLLEPEMLKNKVVILVSDGLKTGLSLDAVMNFLKPIRLKRLVIATPIASVAAVDRMHIAADELHCLSVLENYVTTKHYYAVSEDLSYDTTLTRLNNFMSGAPNEAI